MLEDLQALGRSERKHPTNEGQVYPVFAVGLLVGRRALAFAVGAWCVSFCHAGVEAALRRHVAQ